MSATDTDVQSGLEGVVAFATEIAEPDRAGGALRYRGVDIEELVGAVPFEQVWGLLVDGTYVPGLPPAEPYPLTVRSGDPRVDVQSALAMLAPEWGFKQLIDIDDATARDQLARASVMALSFVAQSARGGGRPPISQHDVDKGDSIPERFLIRWRGEANPDHAKAIDAYWISAAEHGMNASTFTARVVASTGADVAAALSAAVGALSGPLHGGAPSRVLKMLDEVEASGDAERWVKDALDRGERLMGAGPARAGPAAHRPRARLCARRGGGSAGAGGARGAASAQARPRAGDQRRVLVRRRARLRRGSAGAVHAAVHLRAHRRLVRPCPGAEARGSPDPPEREVRRPGVAVARRGLSDAPDGE
jgi:citrate synthase